MRIGLDLDGVLYNWTKAAKELATRISGKRLLDPEVESTSWNEIEEVYGEVVWKLLWEGDNVREMFSNTRPFFGARNFVASLMKWHEVRVITVRPPAVKNTTLWRWTLDFGEIPDWICFVKKISEKGAVPCDVYIDDHHRADDIVVASGKPVILLDKPYNRSVKDDMVTRVSDYLGVMDEIARMERS